LLPTSYRGCWHVVSRSLFLPYRQNSSDRKGVYSPKAFFLHAASLRQAFAHCAIFLTAASRRSLGRVSVLMWLVVLSDQLPVIALVSHYLTNKLIGRRPLPRRIAPLLQHKAGDYEVLAPISRGYPSSKGRLPTCYSPVCRYPAERGRSTCMC
jgi:hypothetical protein